MRIESITIAGFRSFGPTPHRIGLAGDLTAIVGPNASGKTALLQALAKLFGLTRAQRTIQCSDFHLPVGVPPDDRTTRELFIDVIISLPELKKVLRLRKPLHQRFGTCRSPRPKGCLSVACDLKRAGRMMGRLMEK